MLSLFSISQCWQACSCHLITCRLITCHLIAWHLIACKLSRLVYWRCSIEVSTTRQGQINPQHFFNTYFTQHFFCSCVAACQSSPIKRIYAHAEILVNLQDCVSVFCKRSSYLSEINDFKLQVKVVPLLHSLDMV